jgi:6-pyruvoyltetrahydropterin/6-carboxytetrahydropterin synthase
VKQSHHITREIGIDMGHRVTLHGSKCRNLHGHRYTVHVTLVGPLATYGEESGMVMDFGFLKEQMMEYIDKPCDHGTTLWVDDVQLAHALGPSWHMVRDTVRDLGFCLTEWEWGKLYVVPFTPTAENLARHWFDRLVVPVDMESQGRARIHSVKVWETPNCSAEYINPWLDSPSSEPHLRLPASAG